MATADDIKTFCENEWEANKSNCSGFVKAVATDLGITLTGQADDIVDQIQGAGWTSIADGVQAKTKAEEGWLVVAGQKGADHVPPATNGHVVVVVSGQLASGKYPTAYWGTLGAVGKKDTTLNFAWNKESRDNLVYAGRKT